MRLLTWMWVLTVDSSYTISLQSVSLLGMSTSYLLLLSLCCSLVGATNPGLKIRLSQPGLNYAARVAVQKMTAMVHGASLPRQSGGANMWVGNVNYEVKNMRVSSSYSCISGAAAGHRWYPGGRAQRTSALKIMKIHHLSARSCLNYRPTTTETLLLQANSRKWILPFTGPYRHELECRPTWLSGDPNFHGLSAPLACIIFIGLFYRRQRSYVGIASPNMTVGAGKQLHIYCLIFAFEFYCTCMCPSCCRCIFKADAMLTLSSAP